MKGKQFELAQVSKQFKNSFQSTLVDSCYWEDYWEELDQLRDLEKHVL